MLNSSSFSPIISFADHYSVEERRDSHAAFAFL